MLAQLKFDAEFAEAALELRFDSEIEEKDEEKQEGIEVGDYVELENGIKGLVKYIGATEFAKGELIGLEMDKWDSEGHDGSKNGDRYFTCKQGHGTWTRRDKIKRYLKIPKNLKDVDIRQL